MDLTVTREDGQALLSLAIEKGLDIDRLQRLIDMRNAEIDRVARSEFDLHFAQMQAEFSAVARGKSARDEGGAVMYKYAPLEVLVAVNGPVIAKHGFSFCWSESALDSGGKRVEMTISGWGWSRKNSFDVPPVQGTRRMNAVHVRGAMSSYGRRYTFLSGFGIVVADEETDAEGLVDAATAADPGLSMIAAASSLEELRECWPRAFITAGDNEAAKRTLINAINRKKAELGKQQAPPPPDDPIADAVARIIACSTTAELLAAWPKIWGSTGSSVESKRALIDAKNRRLDELRGQE